MVAEGYGQILRLWDRHFYPAYSARSLSAFRVAFYLAAMVHEAYHYWLNYLGFPAYMFEARGFFRLFPVPQPGLGVMQTLYLLLLLALLLSAAGARPWVRWSAFFLAFYVYGVRYNYGFTFKAEGMVTVCMGVMAMARCDRFYTLWPRVDSQEAESEAQGLFAWPLQFVRTYWALTLCTAGLFKLKYTGIDWAAADSIHFVLLRQMYYFYPQVDPPTALGAFFLRHPWITVLGSWASLWAEVLAPLMLMRGPIRWVIWGTLIVMLILVRFCMSHSFVIAQLPLYIAFFPWENLSRSEAADAD